MTAPECRELIDAYLGWLKRGLAVEPVGSSCELTTPFLDRHNDHIQIYATRQNGKITLTDDGYILSDLRTSGMDLWTPKRQSILQSTLHGFGVRLESGRLLVDASTHNLGQKVHSLLQAMLAVNDMFVLAQPRVSSFFWEDVKTFLDENAVRYSARVKLTGRSGFDHAIDFLVPKSTVRPERLIQAINSPTKNTIAAYLFALADTREARPDASQAFAFLNDTGREIGGDVLEALSAYAVEPAIWSKRKDYAHVLRE